VLVRPKALNDLRLQNLVQDRLYQLRKPILTAQKSWQEILADVNIIPSHRFAPSVKNVSESSSTEPKRWLPTSEFTALYGRNPHRPTLAHHVHRPQRLGSRVVINAGWYK
jgi:hypothetical protein